MTWVQKSHQKKTNSELMKNHKWHHFTWEDYIIHRYDLYDINVIILCATQNPVSTWPSFWGAITTWQPDSRLEPKDQVSDSGVGSLGTEKISTVGSSTSANKNGTNNEKPVPERRNPEMWRSTVPHSAWTSGTPNDWVKKVQASSSFTRLG